MKHSNRDFSGVTLSHLLTVSLAGGCKLTKMARARYISRLARNGNGYGNWQLREGGLAKGGIVKRSVGYVKLRVSHGRADKYLRNQKRRLGIYDKK